MRAEDLEGLLEVAGIALSKKSEKITRLETENEFLKRENELLRKMLPKQEEEEGSNLAGGKAGKCFWYFSGRSRFPGDTEWKRRFATRHGIRYLDGSNCPDCGKEIEVKDGA